MIEKIWDGERHGQRVSRYPGRRGMSCLWKGRGAEYGSVLTLAEARFPPSFQIGADGLETINNPLFRVCKDRKKCVPGRWWRAVLNKLLWIIWRDTLPHCPLVFPPPPGGVQSVSVSLCDKSKFQVGNGSCWFSLAPANQFMLLWMTRRFNQCVDLYVLLYTITHIFSSLGTD